MFIVRFFKDVINFLIKLYNELISFSLDHIFEYLHITFPKQRWIQVFFYFFKDHCPLRSAALSFYLITYMVSGVFLFIFISQIFDLGFAENVIKYIINLILPAQINPTTDFIINFTKDVLQNQSYLYIVSVIALFNIFLLLTEIKENFDEILDHYYTKSTGKFLRNQFFKIFMMFSFLIVFNFFLLPFVDSFSQITQGKLVIKYLIFLVFLWLLFNHSSNKIPLHLTFKGALISSILMWFLDYLVFGLLAQKHSFFGSETHTSSLGIVFLFPFWVYLAWNIIFIGLEYIATHTKKATKKVPFIFKQYIRFEILKALYFEKSLKLKDITRRYSIDYRYFQEEILHGFKRDGLVIYDRKNDEISGNGEWFLKPIFNYFQSNQFLVKIKDSDYFSLFNRLPEEDQAIISFKDFFQLRSDLEIENVDKSFWDKFKDVFSFK